ncbi:MAG: hypothetical protein RLZ33_110 [Bacteroidota bacterium]
MGAYTFAQAPQKMSYQAVVRNGSNALVSNSPVGVKISVLQGSASGTAAYVETQNVTTNANGLATFQIGNGTVVSGTMAGIDWAMVHTLLKQKQILQEEQTIQLLELQNY